MARVLINNAEARYGCGIMPGYGMQTAQQEMDVNYFGLLVLERELAMGQSSPGGLELGQARASTLDGIALQ